MTTLKHPRHLFAAALCVLGLGVPEPDTLVFLLLGLGVVVLRMRQLKRAAPH